MALPTSTPTLNDLLDRRIAFGVNRVRTAMPAVIQSYDPARQAATIELAVCEKFTPRGEEFPQDYAVPPIAGVPVYFFGTSAGHIYAEPKPGDTGIALFCHRSIAEWRAVGGPGKTKIGCASAQRFSFGDVIFLSGLRAFPDTKSSAETPSDALLVEHETEVRLGKDADDFAAKAARVEVELAALRAQIAPLTAAFNAAIAAAAVGTGVAPLTVTPASTPIAPHVPQSVAASKVKVE
ncbi:MAG: Gp138 family membrane-puncturing spike protein [Myxococcota bacterium]